ncbi:MAG: triose-phosphate isomerase [Cellvibrionaceae bacterium]
MRRLLVVGNWKMNGSSAENTELLASMLTQSGNLGDNVDLAVCAPFVYLSSVAKQLENSRIAAGGQDVSVHVSGAYTGEISAAMLADMDCRYAIVGHSERRQYHHESNLLVAQKALSAIQGGLTPIICVGESLEQRESNTTLSVIGEQLQAVKSVLGSQGLEKSVIAYEPVWAIGTGLTATPEQAQEVHQFIRQQLGEVADGVSILYGGSVKAANAKELFSQADIDGALVGGASLNADEFINIANAV